MAIRVTCPNPKCGKVFDLKADLAGKTGAVSIKSRAMTADHLTRLKFKNARHPCMN